MQTKTTMRYRFTHKEWLSKRQETTSAGEDVVKGNPYKLLVGM